MKIILHLLTSIFFVSCITFQPRLVSYSDSGFYGIKDLEGHVYVKPQFNSVRKLYYFDYFVVGLNGQYGLIDKHGNYLLPLTYQEIKEETREGLIYVKQDGKYGYVNFNNETVIPCEYELLYHLPENIFIARKNGKHGILDSLGGLLAPIDFDLILPNYEGPYLIYNNVLPNLTLQAQKDGKWGFINWYGNWVITNEYEDVGLYSDGIATAKQDGLWGGVSGNKTVIPFEYQELGAFYCGVALAVKDGKSFYINKENIVLENFDFDFKGVNELGGYIYDYDSIGYIDTTGEQIIIDAFKFRDYKPAWGKINTAPKILPDHSKMLWNKYDTTKWTLPLVLNRLLMSIRSEPESYGDYALTNLIQICVSYGLGIGEGNYSEELMFNHDGWEYFKHKTIYKIIGSERLRETAWNWAKPYVKIAVQSMHPYHRALYKKCGNHLAEYMSDYDIVAVNTYLKRNERRFAHYNIQGEIDPYRKLTAFVDRLIVLHKVINQKDAARWATKINDELQTW